MNVVRKLTHTLFHRTGICLSLTFVALVVLGARPAQQAMAVVPAQVNDSLGPEGGQVNALLNVGGTLFAATVGGVYRSTDKGASWTPSGAGIHSGAFVNALIVNGTTLFAGTTRYGMHRSTDNGETWQQVNTGLPSLPTVYALAVSGSFLYAGLNNGLFRSSDNGTSWIQLSNGLPADTFVFRIAVAGTTLFLSKLNGGELFRSTDNGLTWTPSGSGLPVTTVVALVANGTTLLAGSAGGLYRSINNGDSWERILSGLPTTANIRSILLASSGIYLGTISHGIYRSVSGGATWSQALNGLNHDWAVALAESGGSLIVGTLGGVYRSLDNGANWALSNSGMRSTQIRVLRTTPTAIFAGTAGGGIFRSTDGGRNWTPVNAGLAVKNVQDILVNGTTLYAATFSSTGIATSGVYRSLDNGASWTPLTNGSNNPFISTAGLSGGSVFVGTSATGSAQHGVFRLVNQGADWMPVNNGLPENPVIYTLVGAGSALFAGTLNNGIFRTTNGGQNWVAVNTGLPSNASIFRMAANGSVLLAQVFAASGSGIYRSTNNGDNWTLANAGLPQLIGGEALSINCLHAASDGAFLLGTNNGGVFRSTDAGQNWTQINVGMGDKFISSLATVGEILYAGTTGDGVFTRASRVLATTVSAASFTGPVLAGEMIVAGFGANLAGEIQIANTIPLPTELAGTRVLVKDSANVERAAPLFFVSSGQVNYLIPPGTAVGQAMITFKRGDIIQAEGVSTIAAVAPGLFTANSSGQGVPAATVLRVRADGSQSYEPLAVYDATSKRFVTAPIDLGPESDQVFVLLFGTGLKGRSSLSAVSALLGGTAQEVLYAGPQGDFVGLDQVNLRLSRNLVGRGEMNLSLAVDGKAANIVTLRVK